MAARSHPRRLEKPLLVAGSVLVALVAAEVAVRVLLAPELDAERQQQRDDQTNLEALARASAHPELLYELRPGVDVMWAGSRVVTDAEGVRVPPGAVAPPQNAPRIALLGDSTAFGWRVDYAASYGDLLRRRLERWSGKPVALRNFSVPGYNSEHLKVVLRDRVLAWHPDLLVLHYDHNDSDADPFEARPAAYTAPEFGDNPLHSMLLKFLLRRLARSRTSDFTQMASPDGGEPDRFYRGYRYAGPQYEKHWQQLAAIARIAQEARLPVLVLIFDTWLERADEPAEDPFFTLLHQPARRRLAALGFTVLDVYEPAQALMAEHGWSDLSPTWLDRSDGHPGKSGHEFLARVLFEKLTTTPELARSLGQ